MCVRGWSNLCVCRRGNGGLEALSSCERLLFLLGLVFVASAGFFQFFWSDVLEHAVEKELLLSNTSEAYGMWLKNPVPLYIDFYFFNWTNPKDLNRPNKKPKFDQMGPFRFREEVEKTDINWNPNNTVTYRKLRRWYFEPEGSNGSLDDPVTTLNVIALTAARTTKHWNRLARIPLSVTLSSTQNISVTGRVREFLFEGLQDPLIETASRIPGLSSKVPFDRFGWFYKRNGSSDFDGLFNVETGRNGLDALGVLKFWNLENHTSFYEGPCGDVTGSAGDFWPPRPTHDKIRLFSPDMCRYIEFLYTNETTIGKIKGFRYDSGRNLFDNGTTDPHNKCFCPGRCFPSGALNVSTCRSNAPAFVSYPHFHLADPFYAASVDGLSPDPHRHDTFIVLDQKWGIPLEVAIRLQINILLEHDSGIRMFQGVPTTLFPMLWFEQHATIPEDIHTQMQLLTWLPTLGTLASLTFTSLALCSFLPILLPKRPPAPH